MEDSASALRGLRDGFPQPDRVGAAIELFVEQAQAQGGFAERSAHRTDLSSACRR